MLLVGKKQGDYYYLSHENHEQWSGYEAIYPNQKCAFVYGLLDYLKNKENYQENNLFKRGFWNDTIGRFNFVDVEDSLKHRYQYSKEDTASLNRFYPTLKISLL